MNGTTSSSSAETSGESFLLGDWWVQPALNRLSRGDRSVRIEPKIMDVLLVLARRAGSVVSKDELSDAVWSEVFVTESVITRAIAGLRRAFEDDARSPRFIETIAKRGYRLMITPRSVASAPTASEPPAEGRESAVSETEEERSRVVPQSSPTEAAVPASGSPFFVGQWVRGDRFYGRRELLVEALEGPRQGVWLLAGRAMGKTSTLKQLEYLTSHNPESPYVPLFWDLQGSADLEDFHMDFHDALADAEARFEALGLPLKNLATGDVFSTLGRLRRSLRSRGRTLLLLWDEVEELIHLQSSAPSLLRKLRRALQSSEGVRTVMASGPRLWHLAEQRDDTSPFLHGFAPPTYLGPLEPEAARSMTRHLTSSPEVALSDGSDCEALVHRILATCGGHPSLLQLLCRRIVELGNVAVAVDSVVHDPTVRFLLSVDFDLLTEDEQHALLELAHREEGASTVDTDDDAPRRQESRWMHLEGLGMVQRTATGRVHIANPILHGWLLEQPWVSDTP